MTARARCTDGTAELHGRADPGATTVPVWFGPRTRPLFGWLHVPHGGRARAGIVMCAPFAREYTQAHYALRLLAERLAAEELCVLRFDYDGMGDSAGTSTDPGRVDAWVRSTGAAVGFLRRRGVERVSIVGMRIGATLAAEAAAADGGIDQLVLWDPCLSGGAFLREEQAVTALTLGAPTRLADGSVHTPGLVYGPEVVEDLRALRLDRMGPVCRRLFVLTRPDRDRAEEVMARLASVSVEHGEAVGQEAMMDVGPPFQRLPYESIDVVARWVSAGAGGILERVAVAAGSGSARVGTSTTGKAIVERPLFVEPVGLFAMETEMVGSDGVGPVAVFLSVANEHHIGPGRLWVDLSRRWAALGIRGIRLDFSGLGESPVRHADQARFVARAVEAFADVEDTVRAVSRERLDQVILVGLCSSGYQVFDSALGLRPAGVVAVNPVCRFVPAEVLEGGRVDARRTALVPRKAIAIAFRDVGPFPGLRRRFPGLRRRLRQLAQPERRSGTLVQATMGLGWRARLVAHRSRRPAKWLRSLTGSGVDVMIVAGERESRLFRYGTTRRFRARLAGTGRFRLEYIPDLEHGLLTAAHRGMVADLVTDHVAERFTRTGSPAGTAVPLDSLASTSGHGTTGWPERDGHDDATRNIGLPST